MHSTNYFETLIVPSEDTSAEASKAPAKSDSVAGLQHGLLADQPYTLTGDDVLVQVTAARREVPADEWDALRDELFSKGQPCLRTSPLAKTHGWGLHYDAQGRIALVGMETARFAALVADPGVTVVKAMRSKRA